MKCVFGISYGYKPDTGGPDYLPIHPPSTTSVCPLTYPPPLPARNTTGPLKSSGTPHLPAGIRSSIPLFRPSSPRSASFISVAMYPGATAFTVTPLEVHSFARDFVSWATAPLEAA